MSSESKQSSLDILWASLSPQDYDLLKIIFAPDSELHPKVTHLPIIQPDEELTFELLSHSRFLDMVSRNPITGSVPPHLYYIAQIFKCFAEAEIFATELAASLSLQAVKTHKELVKKFPGAFSLDKPIPLNVQIVAKDSDGKTQFTVKADLNKASIVVDGVILD